MIGNSRLHWAWFEGETLRIVWDLPHLPPEIVTCLIQQQLHFRGYMHLLAEMAVELPPKLPALLSQVPANLPLWIASVIPAQTQLWQTYPLAQVITLDQISLSNLYPTLGIDRALALLGTATYHGLPSLVIDAGTALTFTGADANGQLVGGAILPGLQLQLRSLAEHTAALPYLSSAQISREQKHSLPSRWTTTTADAIWSGVLHTLLAGIQDFIWAWQYQVLGGSGLGGSSLGGSIVLTGGDADLFFNMLQQQNPNLSTQVRIDPQVIFRGIQAVQMSHSADPEP
jgi:type III pantothenate kinase